MPEGGGKEGTTPFKKIIRTNRSLFPEGGKGSTAHSKDNQIQYPVPGDGYIPIQKIIKFSTLFPEVIDPFKKNVSDENE